MLTNNMTFQSIRTKHSGIHNERTLDTLENDLIKFQSPNISIQAEYDVLFQILSRCRALRISPQNLLMIRPELFEVENSVKLDPTKQFLIQINNVPEMKQIINHSSCANPACQKPAKEGSKYCEGSSSCRVAVSKLKQMNSK